MIRCLHIISGLTVGGAEVMLYNFLRKADRKKFESRVISLTSFSPIGERIRSIGINVEALGMGKGTSSISAMFRLSRSIREYSPEVIQTWMYHANLLGGVLARLCVPCKVFWSIHNTASKGDALKSTTMVVIKLSAWLSKWVPTKIVSCSDVASEQHHTIGYSKKKLVIIPNGVDMEHFRPDEQARVTARTEFGVGNSTHLIGMLARYHPQKDYGTLIRAAHSIMQRRGDLKFILAGRGLCWDNQELRERLYESGLTKYFDLLGVRDDVPRLLNALDVCCLSSSSGEAFPMILCEAMACGVPCVATNVGDTDRIVGTAGRVIEPRQPDAFGNAILELIGLTEKERTLLKNEAREHIKKNYELSGVVRRYENLYLAHL